MSMFTCGGVVANVAVVRADQEVPKLLAQQRLLYAEAIELIRKGKSQQLTEQRQQLVDYPLYPYLLYADLAANMRYARRQEINRYLSDYQGTVKAQHLRSRWLSYLAKYSYWPAFMAAYDAKQASVKHQCQFHLARYEQSKKDAQLAEQNSDALNAGVALWNVGKSQPKECDKLFDRLIANNKITQTLAWQRFNKALLNHQYPLAKYLQRFLKSRHYKELAKLYYQVDRNPNSISQFDRFTSETQDELSIVEHALVHLARRNSHATLKYWSHYQQTHEFSHRARSAIVSAIVKGLYQQGFKTIADAYFADHLQLLNDTSEGRLTEWRIRQALQERDWPGVRLWLKRLPDTLQTRNAWRYWTIRSMQSDPSTTENPALQEMTERLARERDFYGFLASDMLDREYSMNHNAVPIDEQRLAAIKALPAMARARELMFHQDMLNANREWYQASAGFSDQDWLAAAIVAGQWQWHSKAIASLGRAQYWDDVELRFPLAYPNLIDNAAQRSDLDNWLLFALARQESAFEASATSPAGAMGLMQVMPGTAKSTARKFNIPYRKRSQLHNPETNIAIASRYYRELLTRYEGSRILASAAYNAGPYRVDQWLAKSAGKLPFDIWMEIIPYRETRAYVRNILMYGIIYSRKMGQQPPMLLRAETYRLL